MVNTLVVLAQNIHLSILLMQDILFYRAIAFALMLQLTRETHFHLRQC